MIEVKDVLCLAVSNNGKWIAGSTRRGEVFVWDAETYKTVWTRKHDDSWTIEAVDFSPDSTQLVSGSRNSTAIIWDVASGMKVRALQHNNWAIAAKFSSDGDRIATATSQSVQVWDSKNGRLLVNIPVTVPSLYNNGLRWFNNHIFVVSGSKIEQLDASTGSMVSKWPVPNSDIHSCIVIPRHGKFVAHSTSRSVTFLDTSTHLQIGLIEHTEEICSIALSPNNGSLAIGGCYGTIITKSLSYFIVST